MRAHPCSRRKPYYGRRPPTGLLPDSRDNKANEYISFSLFRGDFMHSAWKMDRKLRVWCEGGVQTDSLETQQSNLPTLPPSTFLFGGKYIDSRKGTKIHANKYSNPDARDAIILCQRQLGIGIPAQQRITFVRCQTALTRFHALLPLYGS